MFTGGGGDVCEFEYMVFDEYGFQVDAAVGDVHAIECLQSILHSINEIE